MQGVCRVGNYVPKIKGKLSKHIFRKIQTKNDICIPSDKFDKH